MGVARALGLSLLLACGGTEREDANSGGDPGPGNCRDVGFDDDPCVATFMASLLGAGARFASASSVLVGEVTLACEAIAVTLGASPSTVNTTEPSQRVEQWCAVAATRIESEVTSQGGLTVTATPPYCVLPIDELAGCERSCNGASVACDITAADVRERCAAGALSGSCPGECTGTCTAAPLQSVACAGPCNGACSGTCDGAPMDHGACLGDCDGQCYGTCGPLVGATVQCDAACTGGCAVELPEPICIDNLAPPRSECAGCPSCLTGCAGAIAVDTACQLPAIGVSFIGAIGPAALETLRTELPALVDAYRGRGVVLANGIDALSSQNSPMVTATTTCIVAEETPLSRASVLIGAAVDGAAKVVIAAGIE